MPYKQLSGTEITKTQGQETTKNVNALYTQKVQLPRIMLDTTAISSAATTTVGV